MEAHRFPVPADVDQDDLITWKAGQQACQPAALRSPDAAIVVLGVKPSPYDRSPFGPLRYETSLPRRCGRRPPRRRRARPWAARPGRPAATTGDRRDGHAMGGKGRSRTGRRVPLTSEERARLDEDRREKLEALHELFTAQVAELIDGQQWLAQP